MSIITSGLNTKIKGNVATLANSNYQIGIIGASTNNSFTTNILQKNHTNSCRFISNKISQSNSLSAKILTTEKIIQINKKYSFNKI